MLKRCYFLSSKMLFLKLKFSLFWKKLLIFLLLTPHKLQPFSGVFVKRNVSLWVFVQFLIVFAFITMLLKNQKNLNFISKTLKTSPKVLISFFSLRKLKYILIYIVLVVVLQTIEVVRWILNNRWKAFIFASFLNFQISIIELQFKMNHSIEKISFETFSSCFRPFSMKR